MSFLDDALVYVAPAPIFARFEGSDYRVRGVVKVFCSVTVFRAVAASDMPADQTFAQMHPFIAYFEAFLTAGAGGAHIVNL